MAVNDTVIIKLNYSSKTFEVLNSSDKVVTSGSAKNVQQLKVNAKNAVKELGVTFLDEVRAVNATKSNED